MNMRDVLHSGEVGMREACVCLGLVVVGVGLCACECLGYVRRLFGGDCTLVCDVSLLQALHGYV